MKAFSIRRTRALSLTAGLLVLAASACKAPPPPRVDIETLDVVVTGSTTQLLDAIRAEDAAEEMWVAWVGVDNQSSAPLGAAQEDTNRTVSEILVNDRNNHQGKSFRMISEQQVKAAMNAASISRANELTLRAPRDKFLAQLTEEGRVPAYLMFGTFTSADSGQTRVEQRRFRLSLQMMHASSGEIRAEKSGLFTKDAR